MVDETISIYVKFIKSYVMPKAGEFYRIRSSPLIILQLNVNMTAVKKKKKKSRNQKREDGQGEEEAEEIIFYEPGLDAVEEVLLLPFEQLEHITSSFNKIEKELIPLLNLDSVPSYPITRDDPVLSEPSDEVIGVVKESSRKPL